jgi:hypothetical protein
MKSETTSKRALGPETIREVSKKLQQAHAAIARRYPGESLRRQPVHTVYGGAHLFLADTCRKLGATALRTLEEYAPDFVTFAKAIGLPGSHELPDSQDRAAALAERARQDPQAMRKEHNSAWLAWTIYSRVVDKLRREPVEDFRIDFEDGYGNRSDNEEDVHAAAAATEVASGMNSGVLPPFVGIRIKPFSEELRERSIRTFDIFLSTLAEKTRGELPQNFVITLPKVMLPDEVAALADLLSRLEPALALDPGSLKI